MLRMGGGRLDGAADGPAMAEYTRVGDMLVTGEQDTVQYIPGHGVDTPAPEYRIPTLYELGAAMESAYHTLQERLQWQYIRERYAQDITEEYTRERTKLLVLYADNPKELGANETAREARLETLLGQFAVTKREAIRESQIAREGAELARLAVERARAALRLMECASNAKKEG